MTDSSFSVMSNNDNKVHATDGQLYALFFSTVHLK